MGAVLVWTTLLAPVVLVVLLVLGWGLAEAVMRAGLAAPRADEQEHRWVLSPDGGTALRGPIVALSVLSGGGAFLCVALALFAWQAALGNPYAAGSGSGALPPLALVLLGAAALAPLGLGGGGLAVLLARARSRCVVCELDGDELRGVGPLGRAWRVPVGQLDEVRVDLDGIELIGPERVWLPGGALEPERLEGIAAVLREARASHARVRP